MTAWNVYVLAKLLLQWMGYIRIDPVPELLAYGLIFALTRKKGLPSAARAALAAGGAALAAGLLWHESFLPPFGEAVKYIVDPALRPSKTYFMRFLKNLFKPWQLAALACAAAAAWRFRGREARGLSPLVFGLLVAAAVFLPGPDRGRLSAEARDFFAAEAGRSVPLPAAKTDLDIVVVHVCSLSWSDLWKTGLAEHPFLSRFDVLLSSFSTVSSYSEQSALRLLRAPCGQTENEELYREPPPECGLLDGLRRGGWRAWSAMNHSGEYLDMAAKLQRWGRTEPLMDVSDLPAAKINFNGSVIHGDYAVLERWWKARQASGARRAVLYYNTVSLHSGAYPADRKNAWKKAPVQQYRESAEELFGELDRFFSLLRSSGRRTVVLFVPEHGAAIQGSQYLVPGMRDLPLPSVTLAPAGVKLIGPGPEGGLPEVVGRPTSYLALAHILARTLEAQAAGQAAALRAAAADAPGTRWVAENKRMLLLADAKGLYLRWMGKKWVRLPRKLHPDKVRTFGPRGPAQTPAGI